MARHLYLPSATLFGSLILTIAMSMKPGRPSRSAFASNLPGRQWRCHSRAPGLHLFGCGNAPAHSCRNVALGLEFYTEGRFVALTGTHAAGDSGTDHTGALARLVADYFPPGAGGHTGAFELTTGPVPEWRGPTDDADLLRRALQSGGAAAVFGQRATFAQLWNCDTEALTRGIPRPVAPL
jgi:hypothetical protein